ncbi:hypothetical protein DTO164E3_6947 [Paecilomyces variotii]|nr:hypothetical protein DTO164E3_6947 [Paecilomyces variotii]KAJ9204406.1 hypothetical protein DTO032I3_2661 [Paecilomyces variotii]KAJ9279076.1 hypothetical protein DTO021D3_4113 [Paecilomyces variotii]KAJ9344374.1 hypothetical protein DTO027B6_2992 [Paecilomyces variotii]KAJ9388231.1 hypothetical protein DTO032I4_2855 [Paecilomyces variotii]
MSNSPEESTLPLPIIDFSSFQPTSTPAERLAVAKQLTDACRNVGFVYIINHQVSPERLEEAFGWSKKLFDLKTEEKMLAPHPDGPKVHRGYSWPGLEKVNQVLGDEEDSETLKKKTREVVDCKESYEIGSESNNDQPNVWLPEDVLPGFREFTTSFYWECWRTAQDILRALSLGLGLPEEDYLLRFHDGHNNQLRLLHYPPVPASVLESQKSARMPAHTDWGSVTMLFQDDCGGLEVQNRHGEFVKAPPLKNAIIMNIGDILMRWSNDILKSNLHRVGLPPFQDRFEGDERMTRARYSIPYFISPNVDCVIQCLPSCSDAQNPAKYPPVVQHEYRIMRASMQYETKTTKAVAVA